MSRSCAIQRNGGKGNRGMFIERYPNICAAGLPTLHPKEHMTGYLQHYLLQETADALIRDAVIPASKPLSLPPLRHPPKLDLRNAGYFTEIRELINPPIKSKYEMLTEDFKSTPYASYWKQPLGSAPDSVPMLPEGFDKYCTRFGKKTEHCGRLYDVVMPIDSLSDVHPSRRCSYQTDRKYCKPAYNADTIFGEKTNQDLRGRRMKCCLTNDSIVLGTAAAKFVDARQAKFQDVTQDRLGVVLAPNDNVSSVPKGFTFGKLDPLPIIGNNVKECMTTCELNPDKQYFKECLGHLNTVRKVLSKRFEATFIKNLYLQLKYCDKSKTGWLPKEIIYDSCAAQLIRFDTSLIEPLLTMWKAFDGSNIEYEMFIRVLNFRVPTPEIPKILDIAEACLDFRTTYSEMVRPGQEKNVRLRAGLPSGRYFDLNYPVTPKLYCKADRAYLPEETDIMACLNPSTFTLLGVSHRDVYASREPGVVKRVFEAAGESFTDEEFNAVWYEAKSYNSHGLVCYQTFRKAMGKVKDAKNEIVDDAIDIRDTENTERNTRIKV